MAVLEHRVSAILDVDQPWVEVLVEVEHHLDQPDLARQNSWERAFPRPKVDVAALTHIAKR